MDDWEESEAVAAVRLFFVDVDEEEEKWLELVEPRDMRKTADGNGFG